MIRNIPAYISSFILLVLIQVWVLNNIQLSGYINPYLYILFILILPVNTPAWIQMLLGFLLGLTVDLFGYTPGMHTAATVFLAFIRPAVLAGIAPRDGYDAGDKPHLLSMGFSWYLRYSVILVLAHHLVLFYIETFSLSEFFTTLLRVVLSSVFTLLLIWIAEVLVYRK